MLSAETAIEILEGLDDTYKTYLMPFFGFTGGEPFLHIEKIKAVSKYVVDRFGFAITISTNCFWASDVGAAKKILASLKKFGLVHLGISVDDFHQEFVELKKVKNAIIAATDMGITCYVQCAETKKSLKLKDFRKILNLDSELVRWGRISCDPIGRASIAVPESELDLSWNKKVFDNCSMFKTWIINQDGRVTACCGSASYMVPPAGNVFQESLSEIINQSNLNPLYNALAIKGGPAMLLDLLTQQGLPHFSEKSYTGPCHACGAIFQDKQATRLLQSVLEPRKIELLAERLLVQQQVHSFQAQEHPFDPS